MERGWQSSELHCYLLLVGLVRIRTLTKATSSSSSFSSALSFSRSCGYIYFFLEFDFAIDRPKSECLRDFALVMLSLTDRLVSVPGKIIPFSLSLSPHSSTFRVSLVNMCTEKNYSHFSWYSCLSGSLFFLHLLSPHTLSHTIEAENATLSLVTQDQEKACAAASPFPPLHEKAKRRDAERKQRTGSKEEGAEKGEIGSNGEREDFVLQSQVSLFFLGCLPGVGSGGNQLNKEADGCYVAPDVKCEE